MGARAGLIAADTHDSCSFFPPPPKQFLSHQPCAAVSGASGLCPSQGIRDFTAALRWGLAERQANVRWQAVRKEAAGGAWSRWDTVHSLAFPGSPLGESSRGLVQEKGGTKGLLKRFVFFFGFFCTLELTPYRFYILATCSHIPETYKGQNMVKITKFPPLSMPQFST